LPFRNLHLEEFQGPHIMEDGKLKYEGKGRKQKGGKEGRGEVEGRG
jgi:hypothetical protein